MPSTRHRAEIIREYGPRGQVTLKRRFYIQSEMRSQVSDFYVMCLTFHALPLLHSAIYRKLQKKKKKVERALNTLAHEIHLSYHNL